MENKSEKEIKADNRRDFLKKSALVGLGTVLSPVTNVVASGIDQKVSSATTETMPVGKQTVTVLITTDIHSQLNTHDEFFWENGKAVYKKRGGMAVLKTMIESFRKKNPANTMVYDGGDYFHGHAVASLT